MQGITDFNGDFQSKVMECLDQARVFQKSKVTQQVTMLAEKVALRAWLAGRDKFLNLLVHWQQKQYANGGDPTQLVLIVTKKDNGIYIADAIGGQVIFDPDDNA